MADVRRLVLDLLKPHDPDVVMFQHLLMETDKEVQNVKMTIEGDLIPVDTVHDTVEDLSGTVHSIDEVVCGEIVVEASATPQD